MRVIVFGATGMVGQGVVRECLLDPEITDVLAVGRSGTGRVDPKLHELIHHDAFDYSHIATDLAGYDACFFCLGVSSAGMNEADYRHITYDATLAAARTLVRVHPAMTFVYVSGTGTDSGEKGRAMWARVKGATENALLLLPFKAKFMFRPGIIEPLHGIRSKTRVYRFFYALLRPVFPAAHALAPNLVTTTEKVGRAMIAVAKRGASKVILENADINALAGGGAR